MEKDAESLLPEKEEEYMSGINSLMLNGTPIMITASIKKQNRIHRKKRINKKWAKRYGYAYYDILEDGKVVMIDGVMYMNRKTHDALHKMLGKERSR